LVRLLRAAVAEEVATHRSAVRGRAAAADVAPARQAALDALPMVAAVRDRAASARIRAAAAGAMLAAAGASTSVSGLSEPQRRQEVASLGRVLKARGNRSCPPPECSCVLSRLH
jgi:hypothetical protein